jgi:Fibronectin type III domain
LRGTTFFDTSPSPDYGTTNRADWDISLRKAAVQTTRGTDPRYTLVPALLAIAANLAGCGGGGGGSTAPPTMPTAPTGVQTVAGDSQVTISWSAAPGATTYYIYWATTTGVAKANGTRASAAATRYVATGLTNGTTYFYVVTAVNPAGESPPSSQVSAVPVGADTCVATTPATLVKCAADAQSGAHPVIEIEGAVLCSGAAACQVTINGMPVTIRGATGSSIRRIDHHDYPLLQIINAPRAAISDLVIDEDASVACTPVSPTNPPVENPNCARTIDIYGTQDVSLDHLTIANSKSQAVFLNACGNASITHVRFIASYLFGLEITGLTGSLLVQDSLFWHTASNALVLYDAHGSAQAPLLISRTLFEHNHRADVYYVCGPLSNALCSGGQLLVNGKVDFLRVEDSVIRLGSSDIGTAPVGGVEIAALSTHNLTFAGNDIHAHGMWGVYSDPNPSDFAGVVFQGNKLYGNGSDPAYLGIDIGNFPTGVVTENGDCHSLACITVPVGALWALPGSAVSWTSNDLVNPQLAVNGTVVATAASGQIDAASGATVVLSDGSNEIDRVTVP